MTVAEYIAHQTERMAEAMAHFLATTPEDKLVWHPALEGGAPTRSILEQTAECVAVNRGIAALIRTGESAASGGYPDVALANGQDAQEQLVASARELAGAVRGMTEADLNRVYPHPRAQVRGENLILMAYRNMAYHTGQVNLIQMLYGDAEFHVPPTWR